VRWFINYLRQCFCKHEFEKHEEWAQVKGCFGDKRTGDRVSLLCTKCGYHKSFWKHW